MLHQVWVSPPLELELQAVVEIRCSARTVNALNLETSVQPHPLVFIFLSSFLSAVFYVYLISNI